MKGTFWCADRAQEEGLGVALSQGFPGQLTILSLRDRPVEADVEFVARLRAHRVGIKGVPKVFLDKGWLHQAKGKVAGTKERPPEWEGKAYWAWRVAVNQWEPWNEVATERMPPSRWVEEVPLKPWRGEGDFILVCGSSSIFYDCVKLGRNAQDWGEAAVAELRKYTKRPIVWRPKVPLRGARPIPGTEWQVGESFGKALKGAWCVVTDVSGACLDAMVQGVPSIVTGPGITVGISSMDLWDIERPYLATIQERRQLMNNLAYWRYTLEEIADGTMWRHVEGRL